MHYASKIEEKCHQKLSFCATLACFFSFCSFSKCHSDDCWLVSRSYSYTHASSLVIIRFVKVRPFFTSKIRSSATVFRSIFERKSDLLEKTLLRIVSCPKYRLQCAEPFHMQCYIHLLILSDWYDDFQAWFISVSRPFLRYLPFMDVQNEANLWPLCEFSYHSYTLVLDETEPPEVFCNIFNDSVLEILFSTQNFKQALYSTKSSILKCDKQKNVDWG